MDRYRWIRVLIFLRQCRWGFVILMAWFAFGAVAYLRIEGLGPREAVLNALYLGRNRGWFWDLYSFWGQCVLFGIVISVFLFQAAQQYNPQEGCRMVARQIKDHAIVVGYTHLGRRIVDELRKEKRPYVLIERDAAAVDDLVRAGEPVIVDDAKEESTLRDAGLEKAKLMVVTTNDIETALLVTKRARDGNKTLRIIVRCFLDEFTEILEGLGANEVVSSSKSACREVLAHLEPAG